ncbi:MAG: hypothetical protein ACE3L7_32875 [Candidatus Pristimantibacillus sp.]
MLYTKQQLVEVAKKIGVTNEVLREFLETPEALHGDLAFPFYLQRKLENSMEASVIKYYPTQNLFLNEWRRFSIVDNQVRTDAVHRHIYNLEDIKYLIDQGFVWTLQPRPAFGFDLD